MSYQFGSSLFDTEAQRDCGAACEWLTAGGSNSLIDAIHYCDDVDEIDSLREEDPSWHAMLLAGLDDAREYLIKELREAMEDSVEISIAGRKLIVADEAVIIEAIEDSHDPVKGTQQVFPSLDEALAHLSNPKIETTVELGEIFQQGEYQHFVGVDVDISGLVERVYADGGIGAAQSDHSTAKACGGVGDALVTWEGNSWQANGPVMPDCIIAIADAAVADAALRLWKEID